MEKDASAAEEDEFQENRTWFRQIRLRSPNDIWGDFLLNI